MAQKATDVQCPRLNIFLENIDMDAICTDLLWRTLSMLDGNDILRCREVCRLWKHTIDRVSQDEWKLLYFDRTSTMLCVGSDFNWKQAALRATAHDECLPATCMWNGHRVMIMTPWKERILIFDETERALFDMSLRPGVRRSEVVEYSVIDFVYSKRLRLRGLQRTCRSRNSDHPCVNCVFFRKRRKCLNPIYEYFLRPIGNVDPQSIDECLAHLLGHKPNCTRGHENLFA